MGRCRDETSMLMSYFFCILIDFGNSYDDPVARQKFAEFHCFKLRTCTPGGDPVCGFDDTQAFLAEFEDMCTLHKVNCQKRGVFDVVDAPICADQKKFLSAKNDYDMFDRNLTSIDK